MTNIIEFPRHASADLDEDLKQTLQEFIELIYKHKAKSFAAVALSENGEVIDTWHCQDPTSLIGAVEMLKHDFVLHSFCKTFLD